MRLRSIFTGLAVLAACLIQEGAEAQDGWRKLGDKAPELSVFLMKGDEVKIKEGLGKRVFVVEFWATWCGPCKYSIPHLTYLQKKYKDEGLVVIGISDESSGTVRPYIEDLGDEMTYSVAIDRSGATENRYLGGYGIPSIPVAFVVDVNGRVSWHGNPMEPFMEEHIRVLLADVPEEAKAELTAETSESAKDESESKNSR